jgi:hypothetical protein
MPASGALRGPMVAMAAVAIRRIVAAKQPIRPAVQTPPTRHQAGSAASRLKAGAPSGRHGDRHRERRIPVGKPS